MQQLQKLIYYVTLWNTALFFRWSTSAVVHCRLAQNTFVLKPLFHTAKSINRLTLMLTNSLSTILKDVTVAQLVKKFLVFYGTRRFIIVFTRAATGPCSETDESCPHPHAGYMSRLPHLWFHRPNSICWRVQITCSTQFVLKLRRDIYETLFGWQLLGIQHTALTAITATWGELKFRTRPFNDRNCEWKSNY
jgi:hypothetical protein